MSTLLLKYVAFLKSSIDGFVHSKPSVFGVPLFQKPPFFSDFCFSIVFFSVLCEARYNIMISRNLFDLGVLFFPQVWCSNLCLWQGTWLGGMIAPVGAAAWLIQKMGKPMDFHGFSHGVFHIYGSTFPLGVPATSWRAPEVVRPRGGRLPWHCWGSCDSAGDLLEFKGPKSWMVFRENPNMNDVGVPPVVETPMVHGNRTCWKTNPLIGWLKTMLSEIETKSESVVTGPLAHWICGHAFTTSLDHLGCGWDPATWPITILNFKVEAPQRNIRWMFWAGACHLSCCVFSCPPRCPKTVHA